MDFTLAQVSGPSSVYSNYWFVGKTIAVYPGCVVAERNTGGAVLQFKPSSAEIAYAGTSELLKMAAMQKWDGRPITAGDWYAMAPSTRSYFKLRPVTERVILLHSTNITRVGLQISVCGLRGGKTKLAGISEESLTSFDCGTPSNVIPTNGTIYILTPLGIVNRQISTNTIKMTIP